MFRSIKLPDRRVVVFSFLCLVIFVIVCLFMLRAGTPDSIILDGDSVSLNAEDAEDVAIFLSALGYTVEDISQNEIIVPESWNALYASYDEMQRAQGLGLTRYRGQRAQLFVCMLGNSDSVADILVCEGKIIAADINENGKLRQLYMIEESK